MHVQSHILRLSRLIPLLSKNLSWEGSIEIHGFTRIRVLVCIVRFGCSRCRFGAVGVLGMMEISI